MESAESMATTATHASNNCT
jgi:DNA-directed RNA polymerases I, II, and III subunit RPABC1